MEKQENQRIMLTKRLLKESLIDLLKTKSIYDISIRELCQNAGINRSTFYKHYGSQFDLLQEMEEDVLMQIEKDLNQRDDDYLINLTSILKFIDQNVELIRMLMNYNMDTEFPEKLLYLPSIHTLLKEAIPEENVRLEAEYYYDFIVNGGYSMVKRWINQQNREKPEQMAQILLQILDKLLQNS